MGATAAEVNVLLKIGSDTTGIKAGTTELNKFFSTLKAGFNLNLGFKAAEFALSIPAAAINSIKEYMAQAEQLVGEMEKVRGQVGLTAEGYQLFAFTLKDADQDASALTPALKSLSQVIGDAARGSGEASTKLAAIGLSFRELQGLTPEKQLETVAIALARVTDENERASISADLFGKQYAALNPLLKALAADGLEGLKNSVRATHGLISGPLAQALDDAGDRSKAAGDRLSAAFAPAALGLRSLVADFKQFLALIVAPIPDIVGESHNAAIERIANSRTAGKTVPELQKLIAQEQRIIEFIESTTALADITNTNSRAGRDFVDSVARLKIYEDALAEIQRKVQDKASEDIKKRGDDIDADRKKRRDKAAAEIESLVKEAQRLELQSLDAVDRLSRLKELRAELATRTAPTAAEFLPTVGTKDEGVIRAAENAALAEKLRINIQLRQVEKDISEIEAQSAQIAEKKRTADLALTKSRISATLTREDATLARLIGEQESSLSRIQSDRFLTQEQKQAKILPLLREENRLLSERLTLLDAQLAATDDPAAQQQIVSRKDSIGLKKAENEGEISQAQPLGFVDQLGAELGILQDQLGTFTQNAAAAISDTIGGSVSAISAGITNWITGAETFGQAMSNIGRNVLNIVVSEFIGAIVRGFAQMLISYITTKNAMFLIDVAFAAKSLALNIASAAKSFIAWLPSAIAASVSSYGVAAAVGLAAVLAVVAATGGFAEGGYTGDGGKYEPAGIVHKGEYVMPKHAVNRIGIARLERLRYAYDLPGYANGGLVEGLASSGGVSPSGDSAPAVAMPTYIVFSEEEMRRRMLKNGDSEAHIVRVMRDNRDAIWGN